MFRRERAGTCDAIAHVRLAQQEPLPLYVVVLLTERGLRKGRRPDRCEGHTGSCRRRRPPSRPGGRSDPSPTVPGTRASSASSQPPSGPTATTGWAREGGAPPGWARPRGTPVDPARAPTVETSDTSGNHARRLWAAASRATRRRRSTARAARSPSQRTTARRERMGDDPVHPELGELLDHPLGSVPLDRDEGHGDAGLRSGHGGHVTVGLEDGVRLGRRRRPPATRQATHDPAPSAATTSSPGRSRRTSSRWWASAG